jgi:NADPH2:quinone reductase
MKAVRCKAFGPPESLVFEEQDSPEAAAGEVVVSVRAAGVNFVDVLIIQNKYQLRPELPFSPGTELAGVVKQVGAGVTRLRPGDAVLGFTVHGAFSEEVKAPAARFLRIPEGMDFATAAAFLVAYGTAYHALVDRARLSAGETLLVLGASGGVGIAAIEIGKALGARVIACASSEEKLAVCREHGADETIDYTSAPLRGALKSMVGAHGVDVAFDPVGGNYTEQALRSMAWGGRLLVVGFAAGAIPSVPLNLALLKGCAILGVFWGEFTERQPAAYEDSIRRLGEWYRAGRLRPHISLRLPLKDAALALRRMEERRVTGKAVLTVGSA